MCAHPTCSVPTTLPILRSPATAGIQPLSAQTGTPSNSEGNDGADPDLHSTTPVVTDPDLINRIMQHILNSDLDEHGQAPTSLSVVSTCSSLGSTYAYIVPRLLYHHLLLAHNDDGTLPAQQKQQLVTANIVHVIPQHKTIKAETDLDEFGHSQLNSNAHLQVPTCPTGVYNIHMSGATFSISPRDSAVSQAVLAGLLRSIPKRDTGSPPTQLVSSLHHHVSTTLETHAKSVMLDPNLLHSSQFFSRIPQSPSPPSSSPAYHDNFENSIFNSFVFLPRRTSTLVVPPNSANYNFALYPLVSHVLPPFQDIIEARFAETKPGGLMVISYPTTLALYRKYILKCVDLALHQMLALNLISTQACEALSVPPSAQIPSFEVQRGLIERLRGAEIAYAKNIEHYRPFDWGYRWVSEDMNWIRKTLSAFEVSSQSIAKFINLLSLNPLWSGPSDSAISLFIVRKTRQS